MSETALTVNRAGTLKTQEWKTQHWKVRKEKMTGAEGLNKRNHKRSPATDIKIHF